MKVLVFSAVLVVVLVSVNADHPEHSDDEHNCPFNRVYNECGSACPPTCANRNDDVICTTECISGCYCPDGYYATEEGGCVREEECATCINGQVYSSCGSACLLTCDNKDTLLICPQVCVAGCFCPRDMVANGNTCVLPEECPTDNSTTCIYGDDEYDDGDSFPSVDGCNECHCDEGAISCTEITCIKNYPGVLRKCSVGDIEVFEKQQYNDGCTVCTCNKLTVNCTVPQGRCDAPLYKSFDIQMTFDVDYDTVVTDEDSFKDSVMTSLVSKYSSSHNLMEDQITNIEVSRGSVIVIVTLEDSKEYEQSANITILLVQMNQDYYSGSLTITHDGTTLEPAMDFVVSNNNDDDDDDGHDDDDDGHDDDDDGHDDDDDSHDDDGDESRYIIIYVIVAALVLMILLLAIVIAVVIVAVFSKKQTRMHKGLPLTENEYEVQVDATKGVPNPIYPDMQEKI